MPAHRYALDDTPVAAEPPRTERPAFSSDHVLTQSFILGTVLWAGLLFGVDFIATPAKFLSPMASLPIEIDIGRRTFGVFNRVEDVFAALVFSLVVAMPTLSLRYRAVLAVPLAVFAIKNFVIWPILDLDAINVIGGRPSEQDLLHYVYIGIVVFQIAGLLLSGISMLRRAAAPAAHGRAH